METNFYHVTFKNRLKSIMSKGIVSYGIKHIYSDYCRKHHESIYAFANLEDALKWWEHEHEAIDMNEHQYNGEGDPVIIEFTDNIFAYKPDEHWEMKKDYPSAMYKLPNEIVKPEQIKQVIHYDDYDGKKRIDDEKTMTYEEWCNNYIE